MGRGTMRSMVEGLTSEQCPTTALRAVPSPSPSATGRTELALHLPLPLALRLADLHFHRERFRPAADARARHRGGVAIVEAGGDADIGVVGADAVGGIERDPAQVLDPTLGPGVR